MSRVKQKIVRDILLVVGLTLCAVILTVILEKPAGAMSGAERVWRNILSLIGPILYVVAFMKVCGLEVTTVDKKEATQKQKKITLAVFGLYMILSLVLIIWILALAKISSIPIYNFFIFLAVILGGIACIVNAKILDFSKMEKLILLSYILIGAIVGAKYYTFLATMNLQGRVFSVFTEGLSAYGAVIGVLVMVFVFSRQIRRKYLDLLYIMTPAIPLMYSVGKIGCAIAGCCHGIVYEGVFNVTYGTRSPAPTNVSLFPVQHLESLVFLIIFIYLQYCLHKKMEKMMIVGQMFLLCGLSKFALEFLRMSHNGVILSSTQMVSIIFIVIGIVMIVINRRKNTQQKKVD